MKTCFKCLKIKPSEEFYAHSEMRDGRLGKCKVCTRVDVANRLLRLSNDPEWLSKERARCRLKQSRYRKMGIKENPEQRRRISKKWDNANKHKKKAQLAANRAQKRGLIGVAISCDRCKIQGIRLEKHHEDYSQPLKIQWLCTTCHGLTRRKKAYPLSENRGGVTQSHLPNCKERVRRQRCSALRATWWFQQMREVVDKAKEWPKKGVGK